jgi:subtilisin family serine protease
MVTGIFAQGMVFKYWVQFSDKTGTPYALDKPEEFLSRRSIERRLRYSIPLDWKDLPVNPDYISGIKSAQMDVLYSSKWLNGAVVVTNDSSNISDLLSHSFVSRVNLLYAPGCGIKSGRDKFEDLKGFSTDKLISDHQIEMLQGHRLHEMGYRGENMIIALLDTGFEGTDSLPGFDSLYIRRQIIGTRNFVEPGKEVYLLGDHGTNVLSILGGNLTGSYRGAAPAASYLLIQTEDVRSEYHIEEANWLAGAEFADSAGADIINSSLGYSDGFTCPADDYAYEDLDGDATLVTRAADLAASRGMLVVVSAGNSGGISNPWQYITPPADGDSVLTVGAVDSTGNSASFTSWGPTYDGRTKPDVVAQGVSTAVIRAWGGIEQGNGTSFSAPVISGLAACLWQKHPEVSNFELMEVIRQCSNLYPYPDQRQGYGKPNFMYAADLISGINEFGHITKHLKVYPNPAKESLYLNISYSSSTLFNYYIMDVSGRILLNGDIHQLTGPVCIPLGSLVSGTYFLVLEGKNEIFTNIFTRE